MILIVATKEDISVTKVIEWLRSKRANFYAFIYPNSNFINSVSFNNKSIIIHTDKNNKNCVDFDEISVIWFRRGWINFKVTPIYNDLSNSVYYTKIIDHIKDENRAIEYFIHGLFKHVSINNPNYYEVNKLTVLSKANAFKKYRCQL